MLQKTLDLLPVVILLATVVPYLMSEWRAPPGPRHRSGPRRASERLRRSWWGL